jgi:thioredoxin reductase (NADPH)
MGDYYGLLCDQEMFEAKTVIIATGVESVKPIPGELELLGAGVSYCATCDGMLYRGKTIAVISASAEFEHEVMFLSGLAEKVYFIPLYRDSKVTGDNIQVLKQMPREVAGKGRVEKLCFDAFLLFVKASNFSLSNLNFGKFLTLNFISLE